MQNKMGDKAMSEELIKSGWKLNELLAEHKKLKWEKRNWYEVPVAERVALLLNASFALPKKDTFLQKSCLYVAQEELKHLIMMCLMNAFPSKIRNGPDVFAEEVYSVEDAMDSNQFQQIAVESVTPVCAWVNKRSAALGLPVVLTWLDKKVSPQCDYKHPYMYYKLTFAFESASPDKKTKRLELVFESMTFCGGPPSDSSSHRH